MTCKREEEEGGREEEEGGRVSGVTPWSVYINRMFVCVRLRSVKPAVFFTGSRRTHLPPQRATGQSTATGEASTHTHTRTHTS